MIETLKQRVNDDAALVRRGRFLTTTFLIEVGATAWLVAIYEGRVVSITRGPFVMPSPSFSLRAAAEEWEKFWSKRPPPGSNERSLFEGAILAVIIVLLFLRDIRATIIAAISLPLSIFPAFWAMDLLGFSLNLVSFLAITLSTGILVDDAIVEIENIVRHMRMGKSPYSAALEAADEIGLAVIAISLTLIAIFTPASFMSGIAGQFFKQFGITVSVQVFFSLLAARFVTPMLAAYFMKHHEHDDPPPPGPKKVAAS